MSKRILIAAGGTGGHIFPGLAAARVLEEAGHQVSWLGSEGGMEAGLVAARGLPIALIPVDGWRGQSWQSWLTAPWRLLRALKETNRVFADVKPHCVLGMGGFAAGPGGLVAALRRVPLLIHEQNALPGMTNRLLSRLARRVLKGFETAFSGRKDSLWVGNPVRAELFNIQPLTLEAGRPLRILVLGGSRGALALNEGMPVALASLSDSVSFEVYHQAGKGKADACREAYKSLQDKVRVTEFIDDMAAAYEQADLVVARAGALTLAELAAVGRGSVLVPYPYAADDHQTANAKALKGVGAAEVVPQGEGFETRLSDALAQLLASPAVLEQMGKAASSLARPNAAEQVAQQCIEVCSA